MVGAHFVRGAPLFVINIELLKSIVNSCCFTYSVIYIFDAITKTTTNVTTDRNNRKEK